MYEKAGSWTISYSHLASRLYYHNCLNFLPELVITCSWLYRTKWLNRCKIIGRMSWKANWRQILCSAPLQHPKPTFARLDIQIPALPTSSTEITAVAIGDGVRTVLTKAPGDRGDWLLLGDWQQCGRRRSNTSRWCFYMRFRFLKQHFQIPTLITPDSWTHKCDMPRVVPASAGCPACKWFSPSKCWRINVIVWSFLCGLYGPFPA